MVILGIDPGSRKTGYAFLKMSSTGDFEHLHSGVIVSEQARPLSARLGFLLVELSALTQKWGPEHPAIVNVFMGKNADSAFVLGQARGVCLAIAGQRQIPVFEYATRSVKKSVTGRGGAEKNEVQMIVKALLGKVFTSFDESDAVAVAICHGRQLQSKRVIEEGLGRLGIGKLGELT